MASETRPGCWLSYGDAIEWDSAGRAFAARRRGLFGFSRGGACGPSRPVAVLRRAGGLPEDRLAVESEPCRRAVRRGGPGRRNLPRSREAGPAADRLPGTRPRLADARPVPDGALPFGAHGEGPRTIVLFLIDTLRADRVSGYGYALPTTPRLDRFFREGLRAQTCLPPANWTLPSHASLFTSLSVARHGVGRYGHHLPENVPTLAGAFAREGYRTLAVTGGGLRRCGVRPGARVRPIRGRGRFGLVFGGQGPRHARGAPRRAGLPLLPHVPGARLRPGRARRTTALPRLRRPRPRLAGKHRRSTPETLFGSAPAGLVPGPLRRRPAERGRRVWPAHRRARKERPPRTDGGAHDVGPWGVALRPCPRAGVPAPGSREPVSLRRGAARAARGAQPLARRGAGHDADDHDPSRRRADAARCGRLT